MVDVHILMLPVQTCSRGVYNLIAIDLVEELSLHFCVIKKNSFHKTISDLGKFLHLYMWTLHTYSTYITGAYVALSNNIHDQSALQ